MSPGTGTLTPEGANLLRQARDNIIAHPQDFDWSDWDRCIASHVNHFASGDNSVLDKDGYSRGERANKALGFTHSEGSSPPTYDLFCSFVNAHDSASAVRRIDEFLWKYGYPPNEIEPLPAAQDAPMECSTIS